jgi:RHS repeat-associated protein
MSIGGFVQLDDYYPFGLTFNSCLRENTTQNRYQYNGKEKQCELDLGWLDYGARSYMPETGRWGVIDPLASKASGWSPYRYAFDNPVKFVDPNGKFEIEHLKKENKELYRYLKDIMKTYQGKTDAFKKVFKEYSQLSDTQIKDMLTPGKGPKVNVVDLSKNNANGATPIEGKKAADGSIAVRPKGEILLDAAIVSRFEKQEGNRLDRAGSRLLIESTLFHEVTHYGDALDGKMDKTNSTKEGGKLFEKAAYGEDVDRHNAVDIVRKINWDNEYFNSQVDNALNDALLIKQDGTNIKNWGF